MSFFTKGQTITWAIAPYYNQWMFGPLLEEGLTGATV
jgi:hypothetical protein